MKHKKTLSVLALVTSCIVGSNAQATLIDRGSGLLYDDVLKVTWLQDANYAKTSGYSATGLMDWASANIWAANLEYNGLTSWRLATNTPVNGISFNNYIRSYDGSTDLGFNITSPNSELAYMYNVNLGLKDWYDTNGNYQADYGIFGNGTFGGQNNVGLVKNLRSYAYWSGAEYTSLSEVAWNFGTSQGNQGINVKIASLYAWAVHPGDVAPVPIPATIYLFGTGLLGLLRFKRRKTA